MKLSVIVIVFDMQREAPRTLHSLSRRYQKNIEALDYEVLVIDNGSPTPLDPQLVEGMGPQFQYHRMSDAPPSPAAAINLGASKARGEFLGIMIDGAHMLTPGLLASFMEASETAPNPVIATRRFYLGPGQQSDTMLQGYNQAQEDQLLEAIGWPDNGYRLFDIGCFVGRVRPGWRSPIAESNCFFLRKSVFDAAGGADERFDFPGGGLLNFDLLRESLRIEGTELVLMHGEASFHQIHGGVSTSAPVAALEKELARYQQQYEDIRGEPYRRPDVPVTYIGDIPGPPGGYFKAR